MMKMKELLVHEVVVVVVVVVAETFLFLFSSLRQFDASQHQHW